MATLTRGRLGVEPHIERRQWILLALHAATGHGLTPVQLQKSLFLLGQRRPADVGADYYHFRAYHYGPFDARVYHDADALAAEGDIVIDASAGRSLRRYVLTEQGRTAAKRAERIAPKDAVAYLTRVVQWAQSLSFNELVRAVYEAYPQMREKSVFREPEPA